MNAFYDKLLPSQQKAIHRWLGTKENDQKIKRIKIDMKLMLFNKRNMILGKNKKNASDPVLDSKPSIKK